MIRRAGPGLLCALVVLAGCGGGNEGAAPRHWSPIGPAPGLGGQVTVPGGDPVSGAVNAVVPHPQNPDILFVATVNGGIWRTTNAKALDEPTWTPLTDDQASLSIGALAFDPTDPRLQTLVAGVGRRSSFRRTQADASGYLPGFGGPLTGLLRSSDGGDTWSAVGRRDLSAANIVAVAARGKLLLAAADQLTAGGGLYRSTDGGQHFVRLGGEASSGLPAGPVTDLAPDPGDADRFYAGVLATGIFRSDDGGATWTNVTDPSAAGLFSDETQNVRLSVHDSAAGNAVYVGVAVNEVGAAGFFRLTDLGATWQALGVPETIESGIPFGVITELDNGSGVIHFSVEADPVDPNIVYVGGDAQPSGDGNQLPEPVWPNSIGALNYTGRLFRGDAATPGAVWTPLTSDFAKGPGVPDGTAPHADSRDMAFDAAGNLIEGDDGGVFRRGAPTSVEGLWSSLNGNLQITELHSIAWDHNSHTAIGGTQDAGVPEQAAANVSTWRTVVQCDGGKVAVDASTPGLSVRYSSIYLLQMAERRLVDAANRVIETEMPAYVVAGTGQPIAAVDPTLQFYSPLVLNSLDPRRLLIGTSNLYESFDQGDTLMKIADLGAPTGGDTFGVPLVYGGTSRGVANPELVYAGAGSTLFVRTTARGILEPVAFPGSDIVDIAVSPSDWMTAYVIDSTDVYRTRNAGGTWQRITGNMPLANLQTIAVYATADGERLALGGVTGVYAAKSGTPAAWSRFGRDLPNAVVMDLAYDATDDVLVAATLGRGAWLLPNASQ